jgi:hypothetical protein
MNKISAALVKAQKGFAPALKSSSNPHFKSKYADLAACVEAVVDSLNSNGIALIQKQHPNDGGVCVETLFVHESGEVFSAGMLTVPASKQDPQGYGSALTYARRYSLMAACGIAPEDDDGNAASKGQQPTKFAHQKGNERAPNAAQRVATELIEAVKADMTLRVVEKYQAACDDSEAFADQVWDRLTNTEREYITAALDAANKVAA